MVLTLWADSGEVGEALVAFVLEVVVEWVLSLMDLDSVSLARWEKLSVRGR